jgi:hypothetical protein
MEGETGRVESPPQVMHSSQSSQELVGERPYNTTNQQKETEMMPSSTLFLLLVVIEEKFNRKKETDTLESPGRHMGYDMKLEYIVFTPQICESHLIENRVIHGKIDSHF